MDRDGFKKKKKNTQNNLCVHVFIPIRKIGTAFEPSGLQRFGYTWNQLS